MAAVTLSTKGQIVIPKEIRDELGLSPGDRLEVRVEGEAVVLEPTGHPEPEADWRSWEGRLAGLPLLEDLMEEHRREVEEDEPLP